MREFAEAWLFHWQPDKAIWLGAHTLSWDARCAGIHIAFGIAVLCHLALGPRAKYLPPREILIAAAALFLPLFIDVYTAHSGLRVPSNEWRFATGLAFGTSLGVFVYPAFVTLALKIGEDRAAIPRWRDFLVIIAWAGAAIVVKRLDGPVAYYLLESLGMLGMGSLFALIAMGAAGAVGSFFVKGGTAWGKHESAGGQRRY